MTKNIHHMFHDCEKLTSIDLSNFSFGKIKDMDYLFNGCKNLEKIIWPNDGNYILVESISYMFNKCKKLTSIDLSNFSFNNTLQFNYLFSNCSNLAK